jgi:hypothetical protein
MKTPQGEKIYMATIQHGYGDRLREFEQHIYAPDIFRAAEIFKADCEPRNQHVIAIEEVDYE